MQLKLIKEMTMTWKEVADVVLDRKRILKASLTQITSILLSFLNREIKCSKDNILSEEILELRFREFTT